MAAESEECELQQLVPPDDDTRVTSKSGEVTPPVTAGVSKVTQTSPTSPDSNKVSSSAGSVRGTQSQGSGGSRNPNRMSAAPILGTSAITSPSGGSVSGNQHTKFLHVNERLSRGPSITLDSASRSSRDPRLNPVAARLHNTKKGIHMGAGRRSCQHHSFLSDVTDVRRMEAALLHLLEDFHSGKLRAFAMVGGPLPLCQGADGDNCKVPSSMLQVVMPQLIWDSPLAYEEKGPVTSSIKIGDIIPAKTTTNKEKQCKDCSMEQMTGIREQQERLARLHFDLGAQQELYAPLSDEGLRAGQENMHRLMESLEQLSVSIEKLHSSSDSRDSSVLQD